MISYMSCRGQTLVLCKFKAEANRRLHGQAEKSEAANSEMVHRGSTSGYLEAVHGEERSEQVLTVLRYRGALIAGREIKRDDCRAMQRVDE